MKLQLSARGTGKNLINVIICREQISIYLSIAATSWTKLSGRKHCLNRYADNSGCMQFLVKTVCQEGSSNEVIRLFMTSLFLVGSSSSGDRRSANELVAPRRDSRSFRYSSHMYVRVPRILQFGSSAMKFYINLEQVPGGCCTRSKFK